MARYHANSEEITRLEEFNQVILGSSLQSLSASTP
jgi:hypothetical protein